MTPTGTFPDELILLPALSAQIGPRGGLILTHKYMSGAAAFAKFWPGRVTSLVRISNGDTTDMDRVEYLPGDVETGLEIRPDTAAAMAERISKAAVVLAFLARDEAQTATLCQKAGVPMVFTSEYSPRTERQILAAEVHNPILRLRQNVWLWRTERMRRAILGVAAGLQCSGTPTYDLYRELTPSPLLFFDNRVSGDEVISQAALASKSGAVMAGRPLRLVFGGRLVAMKGVLELPRVAHHLAQLGVPFSLEIFGSGVLGGALAACIRSFGLEDRITLRGPVDFRAGWIPYLKENADLFLCCHPQGDPSSTYPEVMSCGVPIAGYDNEAFRGIIGNSAGGWITPRKDAGALARLVCSLHNSRPELVAAAGRARDFAKKHVFETTFSKRARHLVLASRLPEALKT